MISYKKLRDLIDELDLQHKDIQIETGLTRNTLAKLEKDASISMDSLEKLAKYLSKVAGKKLQPSDLFEFK
jgi:DNA-binding Xre family transcriptional regulator